MALTNTHEIIQYIHCVLCFKEVPEGVSPREFSELEIGWTKAGLQVWCMRHECNVMHVDFEGHCHPSDCTRKFIPGKDLKAV